MGVFVADGKNERFQRIALRYLDEIAAELERQGIKFDSDAPQNFGSSDAGVVALFNAITDREARDPTLAIYAFCHALGVVVENQDRADLPRCLMEIIAQISSAAHRVEQDRISGAIL
jgi:hypothetical protein